MRIVVFCVLSVLFVGCDSSDSAEQQTVNDIPEIEAKEATESSTSTVPAASAKEQGKTVNHIAAFSVIVTKQSNGFGYQIFQGSKMVVDQPHIPAISGLHGFQTEHDAELVGNAMRDKLEQGIMPPTINKDEMRNLGIFLPQ